MSIEQLFDYFEDIEFEFKIEHASSFAEFVSILQRDAEFGTLVSSVAEPVFAETVKDRIETLLKVEFDPHYAHPHDVSIAVYMLALIGKDPKLIEILLTDGPPVEGLFWARFAATSLQNKLKKLENLAVDEKHLTFPNLSNIRIHSYLDLDKVAADGVDIALSSEPGRQKQLQFKIKNEGNPKPTLTNRLSEFYGEFKPDENKSTSFTDRKAG